MNKKPYIKPAFKIEEIGGKMTIMAGSGVEGLTKQGDGYIQNGVTGGGSTTTVPGGSALSKGNGIWRVNEESEQRNWR